MADEQASIMLRGFGVPVNDLAGIKSMVRGNPDNNSSYWKDKNKFKCAVLDWSGVPTTVTEKTMTAFMGEITDKPEWTRKIFDQSIVSKWRAERANRAAGVPLREVFTDEMFDYCIEELRDYSRIQASTGITPAIDSHAVVLKSDTLVSESLRQELVAAAEPLEAVPEKQKDWHPGSDGKVLDLVHPSLYPLIYGRSLVLRHGMVPLQNCTAYTGKGEVVPAPKDEELTIKGRQRRYTWRNPDSDKLYSGKFQWLPSELAFEDGNAVKFTSYINNLHPRDHEPLYRSIEKIIAKVVPMWDLTLQPITEYQRATRIEVSEIPKYTLPHGPRPAQLGDDQLEDYEIEELEQDWLEEHGIIEPPKCPQYSGRAKGILEAPTEQQWGAVNVDLRQNFEKEGLQVIVKLANIHLTPDKPSYDGGSWHIEGLLNEHICATALYYYDSENITDSFLAFRENVQADVVEELPYEQSRYDHLEKLFDIKYSGAAIQHLGHVRTSQGRLLTFPNVLHHRVEPFSLADATRPGHRKILALFLVDPYLRILSTANIPPQQKEWWAESVQASSIKAGLPMEVADNIVDKVDGFPIGLEEAKSLRLELMEERSATQAVMEQTFMEEDYFNFCEH